MNIEIPPDMEKAFKAFLKSFMLPPGVEIGYQNLPKEDPYSALNGAYLILPGKYPEQQMIFQWYNYGFRACLKWGNPGPNDQPGNIFEFDVPEGLSVRSSLQGASRPRRNPWIAVRDKDDGKDTSFRVMDEDQTKELGLEGLWGAVSVGNVECGWPRPPVRMGLVLEVCNGTRYVPALFIDPDGVIRDKNGKVIGGQ